MDSSFALRLVLGYHVAVALSRLPDSSILMMPAVIPVLFPERERSQVPAPSSHVPWPVLAKHCPESAVGTSAAPRAPGTECRKVFCCSQRCSYWSFWHFLLWYLVLVKRLLQVLLLEFSKRPHSQELNNWEKNTVLYLVSSFSLFLKRIYSNFPAPGVHLISRLLFILIPKQDAKG